MAWPAQDCGPMTDEDRRICAELIEEERWEREKAFWRSYPDDTEYDDGEYEEHDPDL